MPAKKKAKKAAKNSLPWGATLSFVPFGITLILLVASLWTMAACSRQPDNSANKVLQLEQENEQLRQQLSSHASPAATEARSTSLATGNPFENKADFAKYALALRQQTLLKVEPAIFVPTSASHIGRRYPWKTNIVTGVFWVGEARNRRSAWGADWVKSYGGIDSPKTSDRKNYIPASFTPRQNPFYCALPYNDVTHGQFKPEAPLVVPWFKQSYTEPGKSVCQHHWISIRKGNRTCFAQWEDCGPFRSDHFQYVFQGERPKPNPNHGSGLNVSPAVRDYLELQPTDITDWQFTEVRDVTPGPWRTYGENNHFVLAKRQQERLDANGASIPTASPNR
jgi:hypothetical protein